MSKVERLIFIDPDAPCDDPIERLLSCLAQRIDDASESDLVFHVHRNSENGNIAIFPATAKSESAWQERALLMHDQQTVIRLEDKPQDDSTTGKYFSELRRAD